MVLSIILLKQRKKDKYSYNESTKKEKRKDILSGNSFAIRFGRKEGFIL